MLIKGSTKRYHRLVPATIIGLSKEDEQKQDELINKHRQIGNHQCRMTE